MREERVDFSYVLVYDGAMRMMKVAIPVALAVLSSFAVAGSQDAQLEQIAELLAYSDGDAPTDTPVVHRIFYFYSPKAPLTLLQETANSKTVSLPIRIKVKTQIPGEKNPIVVKGDKTLIVTRERVRVVGIPAIDSETFYTLRIKNTGSGSGVVLTDKNAEFVMSLTKATCVVTLQKTPYVEANRSQSAFKPTTFFQGGTEISFTVEQFEDGISQGVVLDARSLDSTSAEERPSTMRQLARLLIKVDRLAQP